MKALVGFVFADDVGVGLFDADGVHFSLLKAVAHVEFRELVGHFPEDLLCFVVALLLLLFSGAGELGGGGSGWELFGLMVGGTFWRCLNGCWSFRFVDCFLVGAGKGSGEDKRGKFVHSLVDESNTNRGEDARAHHFADAVDVVFHVAVYGSTFGREVSEDANGDGSRQLKGGFNGAGNDSLLGHGFAIFQRMRMNYQLFPLLRQPYH